MSSSVTFNSNTYSVPAYLDTGWAQGTGNLSQYLVAIASGTLQQSGGAFTLTADVNFGGSFGLISSYFKSRSSNIASAGVLRLADTDVIDWRNHANAADISLSKDTSDNLQWNATKVLLSGVVVNADINASAAIAYSKLNLTGSIVDADIKSSAAIALSKLASTTGYYWYAANSLGVLTPLAVTASRAVATDANGLPSVSTTTAAELAFVHGVTSAIQTQLNATVANPLTGNLAAGSHKITGLTSGSTSGDAIAWGQAFTSGSITFAPTTSGIVGTTTNDNATAGNVGEFIESTTTTINAPATTTWGDLTSITLSAGDWDVSGTVGWQLNGATFSQSGAGISTTTGNTAPGNTGKNQFFNAPPTAAYQTNIVIPSLRISLSGSTTVYLKMWAQYSAGTPQSSGGYISARRVR